MGTRRRPATRSPRRTRRPSLRLSRRASSGLMATLTLMRMLTRRSRRRSRKYATLLFQSCTKVPKAVPQVAQAVRVELVRRRRPHLPTRNFKYYPSQQSNIKSSPNLKKKKKKKKNNPKIKKKKKKKKK